MWARKDESIVVVSLEKYYEPQRRLRLVGVLDSLRDPADRKKLLIVQTVKKDEALMKLLQSELFPAIQFRANVASCCVCDD